jgi:hypothetical protein
MEVIWPYTGCTIIIHPKKGEFIVGKQLEREGWEEHKTWMEAGSSV